jgi:transposase
MAHAISVDLRRRVCAAVAEGQSCRQAAARFKVSVSSAIRWQARLRQSGSIQPEAQGGDRRSGRIEAHAAFILAEYNAEPGISLAELKHKLAERGVDVGIGTLWRFFDRRRITLKKRRRMRLNNNGLT